MMKKNTVIKKKITAPRKSDQFGVLLESINSKLDLTLENYGTLDAKMDRLHGELKGELSDFKSEMRSFQKQTAENFEKVDEKFEKVFEFQDRVEANFKVTLEYLSRLDDEVLELRKEMKEKPSLAAVFEKRIKNIEKDLIVCKKTLALR